MNFVFWIVAALLYAAMAGAVLVVALRLPRTTKSKVAAALAMLAVFSILPAIHVTRTVAQERAETANRAEQQKYRQAARAHFQKRCKESAGEKIYRTVENVESIFLERPRTKPSEFDLRDQHWMGDPYGLVLYPPAEISSYLWDLDSNDIPTTKQTGRYGFRFVETPGPAGSGFLRYYIDKTTSKVVSVASDSRQSRYAVSWRDISAMEDRTYWVAGERLQVVDVFTKEVLGERVGYVFEAGFGSTASGRVPWLIAQRNACPPIRRNAAIDRAFVEKVVKPFSEVSHAK